MKRKPKKTEMVPISSIQSGPIAHREFPEDVLNRIRKLWDRVKGYAPVKTLEQWELLFMRDSKPEGEIAIWEKMADAIEAAEEELGMESTAVFPTVLNYSMGGVKLADRAQSPTKEIVAICKRVGLKPSPLQIRRR
jgi:hypothetical protein